MKAADWIDRVKLARGWHSDYLAAKELGVNKNTISGYRSAPRTLDDDVAIKVAAALGEPPELVLLDQAHERAKSEEVRTALQRVLLKLGVKPRPLGGAGGAEVSPELPAADVDITKSASIRGKVRGPRGHDIHRINQPPAWWMAIAAAIFPGADGQFPQSAA